MRVGGKSPDPFGNGIGHGLIVSLCANVGQRLAIGLPQNMNTGFRKIRLLQMIIAAETRQPAVVDQRQSGALAAFRRGQDMNSGRQLFALIMQGEQGFGDDLRGQSGNDQ